MMHREMSTEGKTFFLERVLSKEPVIASAGGYIIKETDKDPIERLFSAMTTQEWGNKVQADCYADAETINIYIGVTEENLLIALLDTYHPDIMRRKLVAPLKEVEWISAEKGSKYEIEFIFKGQIIKVVVPARKGLTKLKDQKAEAEKLFDICKEHVKKDRPVSAAISEKLRCD